MASVLDQEMHTYFTQLNEAEKKSVVRMLKTFLTSRSKSIDTISIDQYNKEIDDAMLEIKKGEVYSHEDVIKLVKNL